jgi:glycerol-3-phosphate dehydrogenase (NAD(P)+)
MKSKVTIIGDGAMATLCSLLLTESGCDVRLYSAFADHAEQLAELRENQRFLPDVEIPASVAILTDPGEAMVGADYAVVAVPTQYIRGWLGPLSEFVPENLPMVSVAKGVENDTLLRPTQIIAHTLAGGSKDDEISLDRPPHRDRMVVLSGPCIAPEVARKLPATVTVAAEDQPLAERVQQMFSLEYFRVYSSTDVVGLETAGATKNIIAIAAGVLDGLELGDNAKAALLARGLAEITRLGVALGAQAETFAGLGGVGDLVTTCISPEGRNRSFGQRIGQGMSVHEALNATESVVEGVATTRSVVEIARRNAVDMPITRAVSRVLFDGRPPREAIANLMTRPLKAEV